MELRSVCRAQSCTLKRQVALLSCLQSRFVHQRNPPVLTGRNYHKKLQWVWWWWLALLILEVSFNLSDSTFLWFCFQTNIHHEFQQAASSCASHSSHFAPTWIVREWEKVIKLQLRTRSPNVFLGAPNSYFFSNLKRIFILLFSNLVECFT